jgi:hypothetical protein
MSGPAGGGMGGQMNMGMRPQSFGGSYGSGGFMGGSMNRGGSMAGMNPMQDRGYGGNPMNGNRPFGGGMMSDMRTGGVGYANAPQVTPQSASMFGGDPMAQMKAMQGGGAYRPPAFQGSDQPPRMGGSSDGVFNGGIMGRQAPQEQRAPMGGGMYANAPTLSQITPQMSTPFAQQAPQAPNNDAYNNIINTPWQKPGAMADPSKAGALPLGGTSDGNANTDPAAFQRWVSQQNPQLQSYMSPMLQPGAWQNYMGQYNANQAAFPNQQIPWTPR